MKGARPPGRNRDPQIRRSTQAALVRKKGLFVPPDAAAPSGDAPDPTAAPPVEITDQTVPPSIIQPGLRHYQATLQQPPQPWLSSGVQVQDTPLVLRLSEAQGPLTVTGGEIPPEPPPGSGNTTGSPPPGAGASRGDGMVASAGHIGVAPILGLQGAEVKTAAAVFAGSGALTANATVIQAPKEPLEPDAATLAAGAQQRPAAYRFTLRDDGKIDVLPAAPEPKDRGFAIDLYDELVRKSRDLHQRLEGTNVAPRVRASVGRLLTALGTRFDDLRPALLLSHELSIAADRSAFNEELAADIIAMMDDVLQT
jgi:hypothetical protein